MKTCGFLLLAIALLEPQWVKEEAESGANIIAVLVDNSRGMNVRDSDSGETRSARVTEIFDGEADDEDHWTQQLSETFPVRRYTFDSQLRRVRGFSALKYDGDSSQLHASLTALARRFEGRPLAGVILLTDGASTDTGTADEAMDWSGMPPVYPVIVAKGGPARDLAIESTNASQTAYEDTPVTILTTIRALGYAGKKVALRLLDKAGKEIDKQTHLVDSDEENHTFRFLQRPLKTGVNFYQVEVAPVSVSNTSATDSSDSSEGEEATTENNRRILSINRDKGPHRILYVSGRPNWEYKFLKRSLRGDAELEMAGLIRIAKREPKFQWRGRQGESNNPLFRGFNRGDEDEDQRYDEPVLIRLNTKDDKELAGGFPKTREELFPYAAVVVDDLESSFFSVDQMELVAEYVGKRGGAFLMLGGQESFDQGAYHNTLMASMLPVHLQPARRNVPRRELKMRLTREGWLEPWFRLRHTEEEEAKRLETMPAFKALNQSKAVKPGATILAHVRDAQAKDWPAVVAQRYGDGKSAAILLGDVWRWGFKDDKAKPDQEKLWRQLVRWLITDVPTAVDIRRVPSGGQASSVRLEILARDPGFKPLPNPAIKVTVGDPQGKVTELFSTPDDDRPGVHYASFTAEESGAYTAKSEVRAADGTLMGITEEGWAQNLAADELKRLEPNQGLLQNIARQSGGRMLEEQDLDKFVEELPEMELPVMKTVTTPLWHTPIVFIIALVCFLTDWILRRTRGMA